MAIRHILMGSCYLMAGLFVTACNDAPDAATQSALQTEAATSGCHGPEDCSANELCVAQAGASHKASCVAQCSIDQGDVCPDGEYCARVVGMNGHEAAACVEGSVKSHKSWQRCSHADECNDHENCVALDDTLGARCVPLCTADNACAPEAGSCALHWDGDDGGQSGCVQHCETQQDCEQGWSCEQGEALAGICVR